ncbi:hypothetical protein EMIHUDRAFT_232366 [Emiliania huxleyi CCMP1516]|uniref:Auxin efflux carrier n=2 Tax=Emiliania huxleyi TaxID=2903 RepID=A0A0D3K4U0_EMIH1|nr:hypothetical protein EMIHUDRAFT_232366 [Emiliania huxleyi CCMP1516]EOD30775.1 hypothetical protein EMIHUDRAFT_232366 [Emiliania huxleyi CCMP1516]|eukprot:XP_005783204.1 hypothetical protein EMIHUDRAFT_232366 [Emiliania huxleyi CCMP1516]
MFSGLLLTSFRVIVSLFIQYAIGAAVAWFGIVREADLRGFGAAMNTIFVPLLSIVALGRGLSVELFVSDGWVLALIGLVSMCEFAAIGLLLRLVALPSPAFRRPFVVAMALPNVVAIPLSVTQSLCEMGAFDVEFETAAECVLRARALVFMYVCFNSFNVWVVGFGYLAADDISLDVRAVQTPGQDRWQRARALALLGGKRSVALFRRPPVLGVIVGLIIGLIRPVQEVLFAPGAALLPIGQALSALSEGAVPIVNLMLAFSLGHKLRALKSWRELLGSKGAGISPRTMVTLTLGRMVLAPLCHGGVMYAVLGELPPSRLMRVIVFVEMAPPTASMVVVMLHLAKKPRSAQLVAWAIIPQYLLATVTLTLTITFALAVTEW